ncbi:MAG: DUF1573 domain-containing protein [Verrucomicrobiales bacterium]|jgi:hypothetical protein|nr:DUF1573 domain-containing protein [Verrucomicrobiales bacterium]
MQIARSKIGWVAVAIIAIGVVAWSIGARFFGESLKITPNSLELGNVWDGQTVKKSVVLKNTSWKTLKIEDVKSDCGCTVPSLPETELKPGQSMPMLVEFNAPVIFQQQNSAKNVALKVSGKNYMLPVKAVVRPRVEVSQVIFDLGELDKAEEKTISTIFINRQNESWTPKIASKPAGVEVELKSLGENQFELGAKIGKLALLDGAWSEEAVTVDLGHEHEISVLLSGSRKSDIVIEPPVINFGMVQPNQRKQVSVSISHKMLGKKFKVKEMYIASSSFKVKTELNQMAPGQYILEANWVGDKIAEGEVQKMTLLFATNDIEQNQIFVTVLGMVPKNSTECCNK